MSQNEDLPEYLTLKQACELLEVHPNALRDWDKKGIIKSVGISACRIQRYKKMN
jgi:predicted site-specific integrase-resolvase